MLFAVVLLFALAAVAPWFPRRIASATGWVLAAVPFALTLYFARWIGSSALPVRVSYEWAPSLGVSLSFYLDGLSLLFALLILGIGTLVVIYAAGYLGAHPQLGRFYAFLLLFMAAMLGVVLADNVLTLFMFWELTSISSFLLIGFSHQRSESRKAANQALLITGGGGLALFAGLIMMGFVGDFELSTLLSQGDVVRNHPLYFPILLLVLIGAFTKSAQVPFHFWLPGAMEAPTPVSAYLHSATMVKAGVYLLARLSPVLNGTTEWEWIVTTVGAVTMLTGGIMAFYQTDLKRLLAYSTISALGTLMLLLGLSTAEAQIAMVVFLLAHALYKGALFMVAGIIDHETGTRDVSLLGGLRHAMPITAVIAGVAALSLGGFGPLLSFIGKELLLEAVLHSSAMAVLVPAVVIAGALFVLVASVVFFKPFLGATTHTPKHPHEAPLTMWLGPALLASAGVLFGILPFLVDMSVVAPAASAVIGEPESVHLALWHGLNLPLLMSTISFVAGLGLYWAWQPIQRATAWMPNVFRIGPSYWYYNGMVLLYSVSRSITRLLQSGYLRLYLQTIIVTTIGLVGWTLVSRGGVPSITMSWPDARFYEVGLALIIIVAAIAAVRAQGRLTAISALGVSGYCVSLLFVMFGAPDLAMTQILVETLTVILFVLVFYHLPRFSRVSSLANRARDLTIALTTGAVITLLVLAATAYPTDQAISKFFAENSYSIAHGRNIVNVILVDFRGMDTMGEITVLSVAAIGVYALLKLRPRKGEKQ